MQGHYVVFGEFDGSPGVQRKVGAQIQALNAGDIKCDLLMVSHRHGRHPRNMMRTLRLQAWDLRLPYSKERSDFLYIRKPLLTPGICYAVKRYRRHHPSARVILEIPTYPYDAELRMGRSSARALAFDKSFRRLLPLLADRIATYSKHEMIFGVKTLNISNGVDVSAVVPRSPLPPDGRIEICAVAVLSRWHGYDRALNGLAEYYRRGGTREVHLHIVGEGPSRAELEELAAVPELAGHVTFHGMLHGRELDAVYDRCFLALGSLGLHRKGLERDSSLKIREYLAKGLPVVGGPSDILGNDDDLVYLEVPSEETPVDVERLASFFDKVYGGDEDGATVIERVRSFAYATCDMSVAFGPVIDYLQQQRR